MSESLDSRKLSFSPADMARIALQRQERERGFAEQRAGDIIDVSGESYVLTPVVKTRYGRASDEYVEEPYTYRGWYAHHDPETYEPGPGWDSRFALIDDDVAMRQHGRTFTYKQVTNPAIYMPETPVFRLQPVESEA